MKVNVMFPFAQAGQAGSRPQGRRRSQATSPNVFKWCQSRVLLVLGLAFCSSAATSLSQTPPPAPVWEAAPDLLMDTNINAKAGGISADGLGTVFVAGFRTDSAGISYGVVRQSTDQGSTWFDSDVEVVGARYQRVSSRGASTVAAAPFGGGVCLVRGTTDGGASWGDLVRYIHPDPDYAIDTIWDVELDESGDIYVVATYLEKVANVTVVKKGKTTTTTTTYSYAKHYVILKRESGFWSHIQSTFPITKVVCAGSDVYCIDNASWNVRKSADGGYNWATLDSWKFESDPGIYSQTNAAATDIAIDKNGKLFVTGTGVRIITVRNNHYKRYQHWVVRNGTPSTSGTWTWETDELYFGPENTENVATALTVDPDNNVHVVGKIGTDPSNTTTGSYLRWLTREYSPDPQTGAWSWKTSDVVDQVSWGSGAYGNRITADPFGNVFAKGGSGLEGAGWTLRRKLAPFAP